MDASLTTILVTLAAVVGVIFGMAAAILLWSFIVTLPLRVVRWTRVDSHIRAGRIQP